MPGLVNLSEDADYDNGCCVTNKDSKKEKEERQAETDANVIFDYRKILTDTPRYKRAIKKGKDMLKTTKSRLKSAEMSFNGTLKKARKLG